jgi:hypothetical protein
MSWWDALGAITVAIAAALRAERCRQAEYGDQNESSITHRASLRMLGKGKDGASEKPAAFVEVTPELSSATLGDCPKTKNLYAIVRRGVWGRSYVYGVWAVLRADLRSDADP